VRAEYVDRWVEREWWSEELDHRIAVLAAKALLSKTDLDAAGRAELARVIKDYYVYVESALPSEGTPSDELYSKEQQNVDA
jgi:hypothetical protein